MMQKNIRLTFDFTVSVDETSLDNLNDPTNPHEHEYQERQRRLLHAVLSDQERFLTYLKWQIASHFELMNWQDFHDLLMDKPDVNSQEILASAIATLDASDQQFFAEAEKHDVFFENVEEMADCWSTQVNQVEFVEVEA